MNNDKSMSAFRIAARIVLPYLHLEGQTPRQPDHELVRGISLLSSVATPTSWEAHWFLGKSFEALRDSKKSMHHLQLAYSAEPNRVEVIHEFVVSLLRLSEIERAKSVFDRADLPDHPTLKFSESLVYIAGGKSMIALDVLERYEWPPDWTERVAALRAHITKDLR